MSSNNTEGGTSRLNGLQSDKTPFLGALEERYNVLRLHYTATIPACYSHSQREVPSVDYALDMLRSKNRTRLAMSSPPVERRRYPEAIAVPHIARPKHSARHLCHCNETSIVYEICLRSLDGHARAG